MLKRFAPLVPLVLGASIAAGFLHADTIELADGSKIEDVQIDEETLSTVTYKDGKKIESVPADRVVAVRYTKLPRALDRVATALYDGDFAVAQGDLFTYVKGILDGETERKKWAPPYAVHQLIETSATLGDTDGVVEAADVMIKHYGESRYVAGAYLAKARALQERDQLKLANETLTEFKELIEKKGLPARWSLECDLALILTNPKLRGPERRDALKKVELQAGSDFELVGNRAKLARAESMVQDAPLGSSDEATKLLADARELFAELASMRYADPETRAGAYTGLGDALFQSADGSAEMLKEAGMNFLRVAVSYKGQARYVPKALYFAGRCFDQLGTPEDTRKAKQLYRRVIQGFPDSSWAKEAERWI